MSARRNGLSTVLTLGALICLGYAARRWSLRWGSSDDEINREMPGDQLLPQPHLIATRAISINVEPEQVWPWVVQIGQGRGGFYSYDELENLLGLDIHSAETIEDHWQRLAVGDSVRLAEQLGLEVAELDSQRHTMVLRGAITPGDSPPPFDFTWSFTVFPGADRGTSRLVVRERYDYLKSWTWVMVEAVEWISFLMSQKMLRGIRDRAERR